MKNTLPIGPLRGRKIKGLWLNSFRFALSNDNKHEFRGFIFSKATSTGANSFFSSARYFRRACRWLLRDCLNENHHLEKINQTALIQVMSANDLKVIKSAIGRLKYKYSGNRKEALKILVSAILIYQGIQDVSEVILELASFLKTQEEGEWKGLAEQTVLRIFKKALHHPKAFGQLLDHFQSFLTRQKIREFLIRIAKGHPVRVPDSVVPIAFKTDGRWGNFSDLKIENQIACYEVQLMALHAVEWTKEEIRTLVDLYIEAKREPFRDAAKEILLSFSFDKEISSSIFYHQKKDRETHSLWQAFIDRQGNIAVLEGCLEQYAFTSYEEIKDGIAELFAGETRGLLKQILGCSENERALLGAIRFIGSEEEKDCQGYKDDLLALCSRIDLPSVQEKIDLVLFQLGVKSAKTVLVKLEEDLNYFAKKRVEEVLDARSWAIESPQFAKEKILAMQKVILKASPEVIFVILGKSSENFVLPFEQQDPLWLMALNTIKHLCGPASISEAIAACIKDPQVHTSWKERLNFLINQSERG
jgi:hypothetical protein